jgi:hypothetical protein
MSVTSKINRVHPEPAMEQTGSPTPLLLEDREDFEDGLQNGSTPSHDPRRVRTRC